MRSHKPAVSMEEFEVAQLSNLLLAIELSALVLARERDLPVLQRVIVSMGKSKMKQKRP